MTTVAQLTIEMAANVARLRTDMDAAKSTVSGAMASIKSSADTAMKALGAIGIGLSVGAIGSYFTGLVKGSIEAADRMGELSKATGTNIQFLSSMQGAIKTAGGDLEGFAKGINKLQQFMVAAAEGSDKNTTAFAKLGVSFQNANGTMRQTEETFLDIVGAFEGITDGAAKTALGTEIFGKQWMVMSVIVSQGREGLEEAMKTAKALGLVLDQETADAADRVSDNMALAGMASQGLGNSIMKSLLPTLEGLTKMFLDSKKEGGGFADTLVTLVTGAFNIAASAGLVLWGVFKSIGAVVASVGAAMKEFFSGNFAASMEILKAGKDDSNNALAEGWKRAKAVWDGTLPTLTDLERGLGKVAKTQRELTVENAKGAESASKLKEKFSDLIQTIEAKLDADDSALKLGRELTSTEKAEIDLLGKLTKEKKTLSDVQYQVLEGLTKTHIENLKAIDATKALEKATKDYADSLVDAYAQRIDASEKHTKQNAATEASLRASIESMKLEATTLGMTDVERRLYVLSLEKSAAMLGADDDARRATLGGLYEEAAALIRSRAEIQANSEAYQKMGTFVDGFINAAMGGFKGLKDYLKNQFFDWLKQSLAKPFVMQIVASMTGGAGGLASAAGLGGEGGSGLLGSAGSLLGGLGSSIISGLGSVFGSAGTIFAAQALAPLTAISNGVAGFLSGGLSGAASAMGGLAGILGTAVPVIGGLIAVLSALGIFDRKPGFKLDNSVVGVGNSPDHFTQSALGSFDVSTPVDQTKFDPLRKAIQALDAVVAGVLGPDVLAQVQANIQALRNSTKWENLDAAGIEKATKDFLMQRYGTAFDAIDASVAATIRGFAGTADELMRFIDNVVTVTKVLKESGAAFTALIGESLDVAKLQTLAKEGETLAQTLTRVVTVFEATNVVAALMNKDVTTAFGAVGLASLAARQNLVDLAGGIEALSAMTQSYYDKYYSDEERAALELKQKTAAVAAVFKDLGIAIPSDVAAFRKLVESLDLSTESGRKMWAELMKINGIFYDLNATVDATADAVDALDEAVAGWMDNMYGYLNGGTVSEPGKGRYGFTRDPASDSLLAIMAGLNLNNVGDSSGSETYVYKDRASIDAMRNLQSITAIVIEKTNEQANSQLASFNRQRSGLQDLMTVSSRSAGALASVVGGMQNMREATAQLLIQIQQVKASIGTMFGDTVRTLRLQTMSPEQQYQFYMAEAEDARRRALSSTDPLEIKRQAERVNQNVLAANNLLTPEQRAATNPQQIANLQEFEQQTQDWLDKQTKATTAVFDDFMTKLNVKFESLINAEQDIQKKNSESIDKFAIAATTPVRVEIDFESNVPGVVRTVEVGG